MEIEEGQGLKSECKGWFLIRVFSGCCAILSSPKKGEKAAYGYSPALFWILSVSCWGLAELIFTQYDQHCSILLAEFNMSTIIKVYAHDWGMTDIYTVQNSIL